MQIILILTFIGVWLNLFVLIVILRKYATHTKQTNKPYTDFVFRNLTLRVFKAVFSQSAYSEGVARDKILDVGRLNDTYDWILFEK